MPISARKPSYRRDIYSAKGMESSQLRKRRYELVSQYGIPEKALGGSLNLIHRKCGKPNCHCLKDQGHPMWTLTYSVDGKRKVEFVSKELLPILKPFLEEGHSYRHAMLEVQQINAQLFSLWKKQKRSKQGKRS